MFGMGKSNAGKAEPGATPAKSRKQPGRVAVTVKLAPAQRDKLGLLGGDAWLREQIDAARLPASPFTPD